MLDHDGLLPIYRVITDGKHHQATVTHQQEFAPSTILVFDRGYTDYNWFELLVKILHLKSTLGRNLSNFMVLLRQQLFVYCNLWSCIDDPFQATEASPSPQMHLAFV